MLMGRRIGQDGIISAKEDGLETVRGAWYLYPSNNGTMKRIFAWRRDGMNSGNAFSAWVVL